MEHGPCHGVANVDLAVSSDTQESRTLVVMVAVCILWTGNLSNLKA